MGERGGELERKIEPSTYNRGAAARETNRETKEDQSEQGSDIMVC